MAKGVFITGNGTDSGKTVVTAAIVSRLRVAGINACVFKPVLSGAGKNRKLRDIEFVQKVSGLQGDPDEFSVYAYPDPVSPHLAAERAGEPVNLETISLKFQSLESCYQVVIVEGCGGIAVPFDRNGLMQSDLVRMLGLPVIIAGSTAVGTLNHSVLTARYCRDNKITVLGFVLGGFEDRYFENDNIRMIPELTGLPVLEVLPRFKGLDTSRLKDGGMKRFLGKSDGLPGYFKDLV